MAENTLSVLKIAPGQHPQQVEMKLCCLLCRQAFPAN